MDCEICADTKTNFVTCPDCSVKVCVSCVKTYLLTQLTSRCMQCGFVWNQIFVRKNLPLEWVDGAYKVHCKSILLDLEMSYMPSTMTSFQHYKNYKQAKLEYNIFMANEYTKHEVYKGEIQATKDFIKTLDKKKEKAIIKDYQNDIDILSDRCRDLKIQKTDLVNILQYSKNVYHNDESSQTDETDEKYSEKKVFSKPCGEPNCRGFLDQSFVCGICKTKYCKQCDIKFVGDHACKTEDVETCKLIKRVTKPCPKCGVRIQKSFACDHMFCVVCKTSFHWQTCKIIDHSRTSNPLFFQWLETRSQDALQVIQEIQAGRAGDTITNINDIKKFSDFSTNTFEPTDRDWLRFLFFCQFFTPIRNFYHELNQRHNFDTIYRDINLKIQELGEQEYSHELNKELRCKYLNNDFDKNTLSAMCMKNYKKTFYTNELVGLFKAVRDQCSKMVRDYLTQLKDAIWALPDFNTLPKLPAFRNGFATLKGKRDIADNLPLFDHKPIFAVLNDFNNKSNELTKLFGYTSSNFQFDIRNELTCCVTFKRSTRSKVSKHDESDE